MQDHSITWHALSYEIQLLAVLTAACACLALLLSIAALCRSLDGGCVRLGAAAARGIAEHLDPNEPPFTPCASSKRTSGATLPSPPAAHIAIPPPPGFRSSAAGYQPHVQNLHSLKQPSAELLLARLHTHTNTLTPAAQVTGRAAAVASGPSTRATAPSLAPPAQPALRPPMHEWGPPSAPPSTSPPLPSHSIAMPSPPLPGRPPLPPQAAAVAAAIASAAVAAAVPTSPSTRSNPGASAAAPTSPSGRPTAGQSAAAANLLAGLRVAAVNLKARQEATMRTAEPPRHRELM